jgi:hypothetical protein
VGKIINFNADQIQSTEFKNAITHAGMRPLGDGTSGAIFRVEIDSRGKIIGLEKTNNRALDSARAAAAAEGKTTFVELQVGMKYDPKTYQGTLTYQYKPQGYFTMEQRQIWNELLSDLNSP